MQPLFNRASIDFTCDNEIGQEGKNSKVFLATDHQFDSQIVVKRIDINRFKSVDDYFQEVRKLHQTRHSFVTPVYYGWALLHESLGPFPKFGIVRPLAG